MKTILNMQKWALVITGALLLITACRDETKGPVLTFEKATIGAYPKLIELISGEYDLKNIPTTSFQYKVAFVDKEKGNLVTTYRIEASFEGKNVSKDKTLYKEIGKDEFVDIGENKGVEISIPLTEIMNLFGIDESELEAGDKVHFFHTVIVDDGTIIGVYILEYADDDNAKKGYDYPFMKGEVILSTVPGSSTKRQFNTTWLPNAFPKAATVIFDIVCDVVVFETFDSGAGCGNGSIIIGPGAPAPIDITNDNEIRINIIDYQKDGGCGVGQIPKTIILRK